MFRKLFVRLLLCFFALIGIVVVSICIAGYLALQQPAFYADLRAQPFSESDQVTANTFFQLMEKDLRRWSDRSIALQRVNRPGSAMPGPALLDSSFNEFDPTQDTHVISITEKLINARFASSKASVNREWQNPRLRIRPDRLEFAIELVTSQASCVLSVELKPTLTSEGRLRLDLVTARVGQLPLPLSVLRCLPHDVSYSGNDMEWDLTAPTPHICLNLSGDGSKFASVKSIKCMEGKITIEFLAPVLKRQQHERRTTTPALSRLD